MTKEFLALRNAALEVEKARVDYHTHVAGEAAFHDALHNFRSCVEPVMILDMVRTIQKLQQDRRERVATAVLAGMCADRQSYHHLNSSQMADTAVTYADCLATELDKDTNS